LQYIRRRKSLSSRINGIIKKQIIIINKIVKNYFRIHKMCFKLGQQELYTVKKMETEEY
jgi:hypothetical protein